jgi:hypothetical protein
MPKIDCVQTVLAYHLSRLQYSNYVIFVRRGRLGVILEIPLLPFWGERVNGIYSY